MSLLLISSLSAFAQVSSEVEEVAMADTFRAEGKIYVVVALILLIFAGLIIYTVRIDRKISCLEREMNNLHD